MKLRMRTLIAAMLAIPTIAIVGFSLGATVVPSAKPQTAPTAKLGAHSDSSIKAFVGNYCVECHGPKKQKGDRRFDQLALPVNTPDALVDLQDILEQLNLGEMPPKKAKQPSQNEAREMIASITRAVLQAQTKFTSTGGQTVLRRLNRREYINTIGDLFAINMTMFDPTRKFPRDQVVEHMDNIGDALQTSGYLLEQYLDAADQIVEKAFNAKQPVKEQSWTFNGNFHQQPELENSHGRVFNYKVMNLYECRASPSHEGAYGAIQAFSSGVPADGYYEIKVKAEALNRRNPYDPKIFGMDPSELFRLGIVPGNEKAGILFHPQPIEPLLAEQTVGENGPEVKTFKVWLDAGFTPRFVFTNGSIDARKSWGQIASRYRNLLPESARNARGGIVENRYIVQKYGKIPQIRIHEIQIRGPLGETWPPASQKAVLGDKPFDVGASRKILETFASRAYRRPARPDEVDRLMTVVDQRRKLGGSAIEALKDGIKTIICSPAFLYLVEPSLDSPTTRPTSAKLTGYELASRLSYFLWSTLPDTELLKAAQMGELLKPEVLVAQTRRMLLSPRSDAFVDGFLDSWLNLRSLGDMPPDRSDFQEYYSQDLENAMRRETQLFTRNLISQNETIVHFIDSDYTFMNKGLARHYGMSEAVNSTNGAEFKKVKLTNGNRGGLLGQGSILTVSANGVETSPVIRGVWLLENILGTPPSPPPDNVPPIDPDVRGAKTMREILTKHRNNPTCMECHRKIDPLGFALENFDPIGGWRNKYGTGAPIDTSGELPSGQTFKDVAGLKKILIERKDQFARMLTEKLVSYACGRRVEPSDRPTMTHTVDEAKKAGYGFRSLIEQVVLSDSFRMN